MQQPLRLPVGDVVVDVHVDEDPERALRTIVADLMRTPREIAPRFFYDDRGSELFVAITELPEYYQTRTERALLRNVAAEIARRTGCRSLVELGSGASAKTRVLLDAMQASGGCELYVPFDVNEAVVRHAAFELVASYPGLQVHGVIGEFDRDLDAIPPAPGRLVIFLGGTIGNFTPEDAQRFLVRLAGVMAPGEHFLLGVDLIKDVARLEAAYNDAAGVTAEFNRNILVAINAATDGDFDPAAFDHYAFYDAANHWIEMRLIARRDQEVQLRRAGVVVLFRRGEAIRTEISVKYDRPMVQALFAAAGFESLAWYTDPENLFGLALVRRA
jgi:L-histidine N-alpha-methyltransferase